MTTYPTASVERRPTRHDCAWCGHVIDPPATRLKGRVRCPACGVANTYPFPTEEELTAAYGSWYRPPSGRLVGLGDAILRQTRGWLARRLDRIAPPGPVLDVGAGDGWLLDALAARGRESLGLEREATRPDMAATELTDIGSSWAAIVFWHSLEHLPDPGAAIEHAATLLAPGGVLVIAVPNSQSLQALMFGDDWFALDLPRHLVHLPADALLRRLRSLELEVERISYWRGGQVVFGWLHGMVGLLPDKPDLWDAIRRREAQRHQRSAWVRSIALGIAALLTPLAATAAAIEVAIGRGGTVYVEARRRV